MRSFGLRYLKHIFLEETRLSAKSLDMHHLMLSNSVKI